MIILVYYYQNLSNIFINYQGGKKALAKMDTRIRELESELDAENRLIKLLTFYCQQRL